MTCSRAGRWRRGVRRGAQAPPGALAAASADAKRLAERDVGVGDPHRLPGFQHARGAPRRAPGVPVLYYITPQVWAWRRAGLKTMARDHEGGGDPAVRGAAAPRERHRRDVRRASAARPRPTMPDRAPRRDAGSACRSAPRCWRSSRKPRAGDRAAPRGSSRRSPASCSAGARPSGRGERGAHDPARRRAVPFPMVRAQSFDVLRAADVALCKSGTTTLEAAVAGCPCAVVYKTSSASALPSRGAW